MRWIVCIGIVSVLGACGEEVYFIPGTGTLPDCNEAPVTNLDGTLWFNQGTVSITSSGCAEYEPGAMLQSCPENWAFTQEGNDIDIIVDEYEAKGRLCGDQLHLEGGWWLSVANEMGQCWYEDEDGDDVGIQSEGNVLTVSPEDQQMTGTLVVEGQCTAEYDVTFRPVRDPSLL